MYSALRYLIDFKVHGLVRREKCGVLCVFYTNTQIRLNKELGVILLRVLSPLEKNITRFKLKKSRYKTPSSELLKQYAAKYEKERRKAKAR